MGVYSDRVTSSPAGEPVLTEIIAEVFPPIIEPGLLLLITRAKPVNYASLCGMEGGLKTLVHRQTGLFLPAAEKQQKPFVCQ